MEEQTPNGALTITLAGVVYKVRVPQSFADREDLAVAWVGAKDGKLRRIFGATLGMCVPELAAMAKVTLPDDGALSTYGKAVYDALRGKGVTLGEISEAATTCYQSVIRSLHPRAAEVEKAEVFSEAGAPQT